MDKFIRSFAKDKLLFLGMLSFVFIASSTLLIAKKDDVIRLIYAEGRLSDLPVLSANSSFPIVSAQGALAVDVTSGVTLYEKNPDLKLLPASTTKIMTALVALDYYDLNQTVKVGKIKVDGQKIGLIEGEEITVENLLYSLLVYSANDAAIALAQSYPGGEEAFVARMNEKAVSLKLENTHFVNPVGLDGGEHYSTARDMIRLSEVAMQNPVFAKIVATKEVLVQSVDGRFKYQIKNINELLGKVDGVMGVKTGWTENARENLVTYVDRGGRRIMLVVLGSQDRFGETKELIDWIFGNYKWRVVAFRK